MGRHAGALRKACSVRRTCCDPNECFRRVDELGRIARQSPKPTSSSRVYTMHLARWKVLSAPVLSLAFALLGSATAYAQASIAGRVTAEGGEALPESRVILLGTS